MPLQLQANTTYDLLLRYSFLPDNVSHYTISAGPNWWQLKAFRFWSGFLVGFLIIVIPFLIFRGYRKRKSVKKEYEQKQKKLELKSIYAQLNPHFIFNALSSIQSLVNQKKNDDANYYITEFSSLLRQSLNNNEKEMVPLNIEIGTLQYYINLEKLRFDFKYIIGIDEKLDINSIDMPSLLLQPLIENGIKHGITPLLENGLITINFASEDNDLMVTIKDNGVGFDTAKNYGGYGLRLTNERIELLNQTLKKQSIVFLVDSNTNGTILRLRFKNWL